MSDIIKIEHLNKCFGDVKAVNDLSFRVKKGELFAFLGVNGAGKSTTISIICGQLRKDSGNVWIKDKEADRAGSETKRLLGVVFQDSVLDKPLTVKENLKSRAALYGITGNAFEKRLAELVEILDFGDYINRPVGKLSGGQRRRIDIARALIHRPEILILDEPTTGLDPQTRLLIWNVIERLRTEENMTVFLTTHYMEEAASAGYVVILDKGSIVAEDGYSPGAVLGEIKAKGLEFETEISKPTLYSYIDKGIFLTITNKELPVKGRRKKKNKKVRRQARANAGTSIEKRPEDIDTREEFGHWEMDTVVGKRGESKHSLLVLTERKTRNELIYLLYEHTTEQVCKRLDQLEAEWGERFGQVFKTITVDNGSEFADWEGMQQSAADESEKRVTVFYCHPYCSFERGSNENQNRLVRRKIPKGENFDDRTEDDIQRVEDWINDYPREMFGWKTSGELFQKELARLA